MTSAHSVHMRPSAPSSGVERNIPRFSCGRQTPSDVCFWKKPVRRPEKPTRTAKGRARQFEPLISNRSADTWRPAATRRVERGLPKLPSRAWLAVDASFEGIAVERPENGGRLQCVGSGRPSWQTQDRRPVVDVHSRFEANRAWSIRGELVAQDSCYVLALAQ